jgi:hypothetical protein
MWRIWGKVREVSVKMVGVRVKIWTRTLLNTKHMHLVAISADRAGCYMASAVDTASWNKPSMCSSLRVLLVLDAIRLFCVAVADPMRTTPVAASTAAWKRTASRTRSGLRGELLNMLVNCSLSPAADIGGGLRGELLNMLVNCSLSPTADIGG